MSGSVLCPWAKAEAAREKAFRLGEMLGCEVTNSAELISCLEKRPAFQIVDTTRVFQVSHSCVAVGLTEDLLQRPPLPFCIFE